MALYLWLISQNQNSGYDTYDSSVVVAETSDAAKWIHPRGRKFDPYESEEYFRWDYAFGCWASHPDKVDVKCIGTASSNLKDGQVVCSSFNAG